MVGDWTSTLSTERFSFMDLGFRPIHRSAFGIVSASVGTQPLLSVHVFGCLGDMAAVWGCAYSIHGALFAVFAPLL